MLYRLAETLESQDRAAAAASFARVLIACGPRSTRRGPSPSTATIRSWSPACCSRSTTSARRAGCSTRRASATPSIPGSPRRAAGWRFWRSASARRSGTCSRPRCCARTACRTRPTAGSCGPRAPSRPAEIPPWKEAVAAARDRLEQEAAAARARASTGRTARRSCCARSSARGAAASEGVLDRARRLAELPALQGLDELRALLGGVGRRAAAARHRQRPLRDRRAAPARSPSSSRERSTSCGRRRSASSRWARRSRATSSARRRSSAVPRVCDARARGAVTLLGFTAGLLLPRAGPRGVAALPPDAARPPARPR